MSKVTCQNHHGTYPHIFDTPWLTSNRCRLLGYGRAIIDCGPRSRQRASRLACGYMKKKTGHDKTPATRVQRCARFPYIKVGNHAKESGHFKIALAGRRTVYDRFTRGLIDVDKAENDATATEPPKLIAFSPFRLDVNQLDDSCQACLESSSPLFFFIFSRFSRFSFFFGYCLGLTCQATT